ncbi:hypothetical protein [Nonomuraea basaltis]|uniref:hypothetical protein n=1 Tax=Nonomuraea basaltis TaxID=2495887 RepID=UPI00110C4206|nr:hypothetical protein [Nonomuraea basaltis]TMR91489.1 hypothetical protein EJK15_49700 [Nonomuraea basaltis]
MYETLMPRALGGGRAPAYARRCWVADALGVNEKTLDGARRQLLADGPGGPWLARSSPLGAKRAVRHAALRLPRETGDPYVEVPAWTLDLLSASSESDQRISPAAWRLYALVLANQREADRPLETSVGHLGGMLGASADTGRRRLRELERAGLAEVTQRRGGRLLMRPVRNPNEAATVAVTHATQGRLHTTSPSQPRAFTPGKAGQSPLAKAGSPQKAHDHKTSQLDASQPPAAGDVQVVDAQRPEPGRQVSPTRATPPAARHPATRRQATEVYRHALPATLAQAIPAFGRRRVLAAIAAELATRTPAELAERVRRRWEPWQWRDDIADPTAVAITIVRRGYHCPDMRCEQHHRLDTGQPCGACAQIAAEIVYQRADAPDPSAHVDARSASPPGPAPAREVVTALSWPSRTSTATTTEPGSPPYANAAYQAARAAVDALHRRGQQQHSLSQAAGTESA